MIKEMTCKYKYSTAFSLCTTSKQLQSFDPCIREIKEFISNETFDVRNLHYIDNETQNDPCHLPNALPQISEFNPHQFTSSSILENCHTCDGKSITLRTRSLPTHVRNKKRPFSTSDNLSELYAKVNFSKKRKNRMRNDEAAIIAMSKSRSQFLNNKDTDILVDNEAVIVYDERTAL
uniref:ACYPI003318 protein n=1 Tax=Acyrthosiphon pisum TaxID=7029 RepID=C4WX82_ACYPI|nr:ACYPI003318 [Acyrthosiphon pisum]